MQFSRDHWYPVAQSDDLVLRHVFHGQLHGVELALWRSDDGRVNAWENRCPHRSVRLSIGVNTGTTLRCQYHGWQFQSGDGQCVHIPSAKDVQPARSLCAKKHAVVEQQGLVWVNLAAPYGAACEQDLTVLTTPLRSLVIHAPIDKICEQLRSYSGLDANAVAGSPKLVCDDASVLELHWLSAIGAARNVAHKIRCHLQPADASRSIVYASVEAETQDERQDERQLRLWHQQKLSALRRTVEAQASPSLKQAASDGAANLAAKIPTSPVLTQPQTAPLLFKAKVIQRWQTAEGILAFELEPLAAVKPAWEAGAHIDVHTPAGLIRQYSLINTPHERHTLMIAVQLEPHSRGGSRAMHEAVDVGDTLVVSQPKNHFPLLPKKGGLLIAGGIGITPILAMGAALQSTERAYALHYFTRSARHIAFSERLKNLSHVKLHPGLTVEQTRAQIVAALDTLKNAVAAATPVYVCGPRPLVDMVCEQAKAAGLAESQIHFELFANTVTHADDRPFRVRLAKSQVEFLVPAGISLADRLKAEGIAIDTSCEQGVCGTCRTQVVQGEVEHRDVYLSAEEKRSHRYLMPCVSRSCSELLVLDL